MSGRERRRVCRCEERADGRREGEGGRGEGRRRRCDAAGPSGLAPRVPVAAAHGAGDGEGPGGHAAGAAGPSVAAALGGRR